MEENGGKNMTAEKSRGNCGSGTEFRGGGAAAETCTDCPDTVIRQDIREGTGT